MSGRKANRYKDKYGSQLRRSEFDDELLRDNIRSNNRLKTQMQLQDRAHRVVMKDLGKEAHLLQNKLENDRKIVSLGLYGYKFGTSSPQSPRRYISTSPTGKVSSNSSIKPVTQKVSTGKTEKRFPWDQDPVDADSTVERDSVLSTRTTMNMSKSSARLKNSALVSRYPSSRGQSDDFLTTLLSDAMNDELMYTKSPEMMTASLVTQDEPKTARRRKAKTPLQRSSSTTNSIVNALNVRETEPLYQ